MCFHYALTAKAKQAKARYSQVKNDISVIHANGFEHPKMPVILDSHTADLNYLTWGLIPSWAKNDNISSKTLNARSETVHDKVSFKGSISSKRCLVIASGYYEYHTYKGKSYPYFISLKSNELFSFAGIWSTWIDVNTAEKVDSFSILTTNANSLVAKIHNNPKASKDARMPVILSKEKEFSWLRHIEKNEFKDFFHSFPDREMKAEMISKIGCVTNQLRLF